MDQENMKRCENCGAYIPRDYVDRNFGYLELRMDGLLNSDFETE